MPGFFGFGSLNPTHGCHFFHFIQAVLLIILFPVVLTGRIPLGRVLDGLHQVFLIVGMDGNGKFPSGGRNIELFLTGGLSSGSTLHDNDPIHRFTLGRRRGRVVTMREISIILINSHSVFALISDNVPILFDIADSDNITIV